MTLQHINWCWANARHAAERAARRVAHVLPEQVGGESIACWLGRARPDLARAVRAVGDADAIAALDEVHTWTVAALRAEERRTGRPGRSR